MNRLKKTLVVFLPLLLSWHPGKSQDQQSNIYAVIVGVAGYHDGQIPNLKFAKKDAQDFYNLLRSPVCGSVPEENIALLVDTLATRANVMKEVISKFSRAHDNDMIIFYFSGHGIGGESSENGYLLSYDTEMDNEGATAISMDEIKLKIERSQAKMKVSYIDACHAGLFKSAGKGLSGDENAAIAHAYQQGLASAGDGNVSFLASSSREESQEPKKFENGVFTYYLIRGLKGEADRFQKNAEGYNNGVVTISELSAYLINNVEKSTDFKQTPNISGSYDDLFPLSVVSPDVSISKEMSKRPARKVTIENVNYAAGHGGDVPLPVKYDLADKPFSSLGYNNPFGFYNFINGLKEPLMIYHISNICTDCNIVIPAGQIAKTPKLPSDQNMANGRRILIDRETTVYFRTLDESKPVRYGKLTVTVQGFVEKTMIVSEANLYLSKVMQL